MSRRVIDWDEFEHKVATGVAIQQQELDAADAELSHDRIQLSFEILVLRVAAALGLIDGSKVDAAFYGYELLARIHGKKMESRTCAVFDYLLITNDEVVSPIEGGGVVDIRKEVRLPCGIADRVIIHKDGSCTVVEVKPGGSRTDHAKGLGQALMYAAALREMGIREVRAAICVEGELDAYVASACKYAGAAYINIPTFLVGLLDGYSEEASLAFIRVH